MKLLTRSLLLLCGLWLLAIPACQTFRFRANYQNANALMHAAAANGSKKLFLKAHLKNGDICILYDRWKIDTVAGTVAGTGARYDFNRLAQESGPLTIPLRSVAIFETNKRTDRTETGRIAALTILAAVDLVGGIICYSLPKSCFGSCPTFYLNEHDNFHFANAEGFSNAITPSMEYGDADALDTSAAGGSDFPITMKNEALETHCLRDVQLLACPHGPGERVYQSRYDSFYRCGPLFPLRHAQGPEGDATSLLRDQDRKERFSLSDPQNLRSREEVLLDFDQVADTGALGLVVSFRQSLMTTYMIYSAIGYMGDEVADLFAAMETQPGMKSKLEGGLRRELGDIEIWSWDPARARWNPEPGFYETGPIAINRQLAPLRAKSADGHVRLKLVLNKGLWRIDQAALTGIRARVTPQRIPVSRVQDKGREDPASLSALLDPARHLISMPGSEYTFHFALPRSYYACELFLYSKGYYLEWMRAHWLKDKDLLKLRQMIESPQAYLRNEAAPYKAYERDMEAQFWNSKVDTKHFNYHES